MATIQWSADPALGFPIAPYIIRLARAPLSLTQFGNTVSGLTLRAGNGYFLSLLAWVRGSTGALCLTARLSAADPTTEVWATDMLGAEIPGTRQSAIAPDGSAFLGPDLFGLRATGAIDLSEIAIFAMAPNAEVAMDVMAEVGPPFANAPQYQTQSYLGKPHTPRDALAVRLQADALARANTPPPQSGRLDSEIHRRDPQQFANDLVHQQLFALAEQNLDRLIGTDSWMYSQPISGSDGTIEICPARLWQYLGLIGPVESTVFGQSVSIPVEGPYPELKSGRDIFEAVRQSRQLPFPYITVNSFHASEPVIGTNETNRVTQQKPAQLCLQTVSGKHSYSATEPPRAPVSLDAPATADIELRLHRSLSDHAHFVGLQSINGLTFEDDESGVPKAFFASSDVADLSVTGAPRVVIGPVDLPLEGPGEATVVDHPRDVFGRWPDPVPGICPLPAWPVTAPGLISVEISYGIGGTVDLSAILSWDWTVRTPYEIRLGLRIASSGDNTLENLRPADGIQRPGLATLHLSVRFSGDQAPFLYSSGTLPRDITIAALPLPQTAGENDVRSYVLTMSLGNASTIFTDENDQSLALSADAWEAVGGRTEARRSKAVALFRQLHDPRPPVLDGDLWRFLWTARANGAGFASVRLPRPRIVSGKVAGFNVWRANESAVLDLAIAEEFGSSSDGDSMLSAIREERDMSVRLIEIQALIEKHIWKSTFLRSFVNLFEAADSRVHEGDYDLILPGSLSGLEFVMFTAITPTGVASDKIALTNGTMQLSNLVAVAVPVERPPERPRLRILTSDVTGSFAITGTCIALAGVPNGYTARDVRIFWSARSDIEDASQLMQRLAPNAVLSRATARNYIPEIDDICDRMGMPVVHIYLMKPPQTWRRQSWAADLLAEDGAAPTQQIASPRSQLLRTLMVPSRGPELRIERRTSTTSGTQAWVVSVVGIFPDVPPPYAPCEVFLQFIESPQGNVKATNSKLFKDFVQAGMQIVASGATMEGKYDQAEDRLVVTLVGGSAPIKGRVAVSDPSGRIVKIDLD